MRTADFDYQLPEELVAQAPLPQRSASRLLVVDPATSRCEDARIAELPRFLRPGDLLVFNDTRVIKARLLGRKDSGGRVEILVERLLSPREALAHVRASRSPGAGQLLTTDDGDRLEVLGRSGEHFRLASEAPLTEILERSGHVPLPPYIRRADSGADERRYQTVYAREPGAVAAPTAGLHFDESLLARLEAAGIGRAFVTLHVGAGTFSPVRSETVEGHSLHSEWLQVSDAVCEQIRETRRQGGRVIAVGTTVVRSLETAASTGRLAAYSGETKLFIYPGYRFRIIDAMLTNFHLPRSSLLMLVSAFAGRRPVLDAYAHAVRERYRFFSYGDAMLLWPAGGDVE